MAFLVSKNAYLTVGAGATDLSDHIKSVTLTYAAEELDDSAMGATAKSRTTGLKDWSLEVEFIQDYAAGKVDATLFPLVGAAPFAIVFKPDGDTTAVTNPKFTGNAVLTSYSPATGSVGQLSTTTVTFLGDGDLSRATSD